MKKTTLVLIIVGLLFILLVGGRFYFSEFDFSPTNPLWNGMMGLSLNKNVMPLGSLDGLKYGGHGERLLIISPSKDFTKEDSCRILSFMMDGGEVIIMDDYGTSNTLLDKIDSPVALRQVPLCQGDGFYKRPSFPEIKRIRESSLTTNVSTLVLNHPVSLSIYGNATIIAETSDISWLDYNDNADVDGKEVFDPFTVIAEAGYGKGKLTVIGDPDIIINSMTDKGDNQVFLDNIMQGGMVYMDAGHGQDITPVGQLYYILRYSIFAQLICTVILFIAGYLYIRRGPILSSIRKQKSSKHKEVDKRSYIIDYMGARLPLKEKELMEIKKKL